MKVTEYQSDYYFVCMLVLVRPSAHLLGTSDSLEIMHVLKNNEYKK